MSTRKEDYVAWKKQVFREDKKEGGKDDCMKNGGGGMG